jgi:XTP/dITP diphosphohydrolase
MLLYVATSNPGKLRDFAAANSSIAEQVTILSLPGLNHIPAPLEDQPTFEGNATLKALYYSSHAPGQIVLADDSGLEVDCLNGNPGVRSARYADDQHFPTTPGSSADERNNAALLRALDGIPESCRRARYRCVLTAARDGKIIATASGTVEGTILLAPQGTGGFGYDPLFYLPELNQAMSEIDLETKLTLSHRGRALAALLLTMNNARDQSS